MKEEEDDLLPRFAAAEGVTCEYLMQLGRLFETAKLHAPSRWVLLNSPMPSIQRAGPTAVWGSKEDAVL
jgi:hypothetical protein